MNYKLVNIVGEDVLAKYEKLLGEECEIVGYFNVGTSMSLMFEDGVLQTSPIEGVVEEPEQIIIHTKNSIYTLGKNLEEK
ncbi:hypothetical protein A4S06_05305 [Erysipelotrichaceae bacterium MTC7]|nr:hypothetical protein A4S06_05305 [Erysipelotrichaceae bacterium MTC7]